MTSCSIERWFDHESVRLRAAGWTALVVPEMGGALVELVNEPCKASVLNTPRDFATLKGRPRIYGIPVLFPPNRIRDGRFGAHGRKYQLPINSPDANHCHGMIGLEPWRIQRQQVADGAAEVELAYANEPGREFYGCFPHRFSISIVYRLSPAGLAQEVHVKNQGGEAMPVGLGFHTSFRVPFIAGGRPSEVRLRLAVGKKWDLDERSLPTGRLLELEGGEVEYRTAGVRAAGAVIREHYAGLPFQKDGRAVNAAILEDGSAGVRVVYEAGPSFKHWMVWNDGGDKGYICPEPMTWCIDAPNLALPADLTGYRSLAPGEAFSDRLAITIEKIQPVKGEMG